MMFSSLKLSLLLTAVFQSVLCSAATTNLRSTAQTFRALNERVLQDTVDSDIEDNEQRLKVTYIVASLLVVLICICMYYYPGPYIDTWEEVDETPVVVAGEEDGAEKPQPDKKPLNELAEPDRDVVTSGELKQSL